MPRSYAAHVQPSPPAATGAAAGPETGRASIAERRCGMLLCAATIAGSAALLLVLLRAAVP